MRSTVKLMMLAMTFLAPFAETSAAADEELIDLQKRVEGRWTSIACEVRPQLNPSDPKLAPLPSYLTRDFTYDGDGGFAATITVYADAGCKVPGTSFDFAGEIKWHGPNPAAKGAYSQDYILNRKLELTVWAEPMVEQLNTLPDGACGDGKFIAGKARNILGKPCVLLKFVGDSKYVVDHDFLYVREDSPNMLFMGAKHVDGTGFYLPEQRPVVGLQQPLMKAN